MKIRINGSWVDTSLYIRDGGVWKYIGGNPSSANEIVVYITSTTTNVNVASLFGSYWTQNIRKKLIINPGVNVGATNSANYALVIPSGLSRSLAIDNFGSILGAGGLANSGTGGNAILANSSVSINNQGTIYAGGGGGGIGGAGGLGFYDCSYIQILGATGAPGISGCNEVCQYWFQNYDAFCNSGCEGYFIGDEVSIQYNTCSECGVWVYQNCYSGGGAGGSGGLGQGFNQNLTGGSPGGAGGLNAGVGGFGGTGGNWGQSGGNGFSGSNGNYTEGNVGGPGGLAGFYIVNNGNVTWTNLGTVAGRVI
jgi:hypothetical protein